MKPTIEQTIFGMLTENTGASILDSGSAYGRNWQRNQALTIEDFRNRPAARLEIDRYERDGQVHYDATPTVDVFHLLTHCLELDEACRAFNALPVDDWQSDEWYGVSAEGEAWLKARGFTQSSNGGFNTYNWCATIRRCCRATSWKTKRATRICCWVTTAATYAADTRTPSCSLDDWGERDPITGDSAGFGVPAIGQLTPFTEVSLYNHETGDSDDCPRGDDELWQSGSLLTYRRPSRRAQRLHRRRPAVLTHTTNNNPVGRHTGGPPHHGS